MINSAESTTDLVRSTFNAAAEHFDDEPLFFWGTCGRRTVELASPSRGSQVLDVCCGTGSSALAAASRVGPTGSVVGVDLAENILARARTKARDQGLSNVRFRSGDLRSLDIPDETMDLAICVFGLYFATDLPAAIRELWRTVKPGGMLAVTTWGRRALEPANSLFLNAVDAQMAGFRVGPDRVSWARINSSQSLRKAFVDGGARHPAITTETIRSPMDADRFWNVVIGSGYRIFLDVSGQSGTTAIEQSFRRGMAKAGGDSVIADVLYARASKDS